MPQTQLAREDTEQFRLEARTIARLEHPHIVRVLDFGMEERTPFLVMSYASNGTLRARQHHRGVEIFQEGLRSCSSWQPCSS